MWAVFLFLLVAVAQGPTATSAEIQNEVQDRLVEEGTLDNHMEADLDFDRKRKPKPGKRPKKPKPGKKPAVSKPSTGSGTVPKPKPIKKPAKKKPGKKKPGKKKPAKKPTKPKPSTGSGSGSGTVTKPAKKPAKKPGKKPGKRPGKKPAKKPAKKPGKKPTGKPGSTGSAENTFNLEYNKRVNFTHRAHASYGYATVLNETTFKLTHLYYDGAGPKTNWIVGTKDGIKVGSTTYIIDSLNADGTVKYDSADVTDSGAPSLSGMAGSTYMLKLPVVGGKQLVMKDIKWIALYCRKVAMLFMEVLIPAAFQ